MFSPLPPKSAKFLACDFKKVRQDYKHLSLKAHCMHMHVHLHMHTVVLYDKPEIHFKEVALLTEE